ncbi:MAG: hypothetical protein KKE39_02925 [Bacteroidetes bacterium]|nr:hypothetical protein [Bacteroidota bacterium]MBU1373328.1 hypothetical protein [Bacteroidota bacterium]MBU1484419.1 hypothetical protein [Bacteroidota bacterium]MBU1762213.1 hypothetical protein [Bacteroidota bacterium]MBU2046996.1 hypothetical protein [Bacteroidota bacterium]
MMTKHQILKKIGNIIQELKEQHEYLSQVDEISALELELFAANADFLSDHLEILKKLGASSGAEKTTHLPFEPKKEVVKEQTELLKAKVAEEQTELKIEEVKFEDEKESLEKSESKKSFFSFSFDEEPSEMVFDFEKKIAVEDVFDRELSEEEQKLLKIKSFNIPEEEVLETEEEDVEEEEELGPEPFIIEQKKEEKPLQVIETEIKLETKIQEKRLTLNEMLSSKLGNKVNKSGGKAIDDLKAAISLNDKMVFIKELFNGYNLAYSEAIEIINRFESFEAADNFLQKNYAKKNDWDAKTTTVNRLYDYLNRKFIN